MSDYLTHLRQAVNNRIETGELSEGAVKELMKGLVPTPVWHMLKRTLHAKKYEQAVETYNSLMKQPERGYTPQLAMAKAAITVGISARELRKVWPNISQTG